MEIKIYNSLGRRKETFQPIEPGTVRMYCCGPTVYDLLHIGNFRGAVFYNFLRNYLEHVGFQVTFVYNFTDVDDKIIHRANAEKVDSSEISEKYIEEFWKDFNALELTRHSRNPKVTEFMTPIIELVQRLIDRGKAYVSDGDVFFSVKEFPEYGKLSGRITEELESGARIEVNPKKRDPLDFALWKASKPGEPSWDSPWGKGRPGWHIECSAMSQAILGEQIDIHGGGMDLLFPHHENEIAQSEGASGQPFARYWVHNNMITFDGQKMSKSLGNIRTMRSFLEQYNAEIFKFMILSVHYRSVLDFSDAALEQAISGLARIYSALSVAQETLAGFSGQSQRKDAGEEFLQALTEAQKQTETAMADDFNSSVALAKIFELVRLFNKDVKRGHKPSATTAAKSRVLVDHIHLYGRLLSLFQQPPEEYLRLLDDMLLEQKGLRRGDIDALVAERSSARTKRDFARSDELRDQLLAKGISLQDTPQGTYWEVAK